MLRESVKDQHNKAETKARVRVANVWRQAHEGASPKPGRAVQVDPLEPALKLLELSA